MAQGQQKENVSEPTTTSAEQPKAAIAARPSRDVDVPRTERIAPLSAFRRFMDDMDRLFSGFGFGGPLLGGLGPVDLIGGGGWSPAIETLERDNRLVFRADLPGLKKDDVKVEIVDDELVVSGERKQSREESKGGRYYSECRYGSFERRIMLPEGVDPESVEATFDDGVLEISMATPERVTSRAKKVTIKTGKEKGVVEQDTEKGVDSIH